jgi:hypothetical protein
MNQNLILLVYRQCYAVVQEKRNLNVTIFFKNITKKKHLNRRELFDIKLCLADQS